MMQGTVHLQHTLGAEEDRDGGMVKYHKCICHKWKNSSSADATQLPLCPTETTQNTFTY